MSRYDWILIRNNYIIKYTQVINYVLSEIFYINNNLNKKDKLKISYAI